MTEKNIFVYKLLVMKYFRTTPPPTPTEKGHPPLSQQPPLKIEILSSTTPFLKIW